VFIILCIFFPCFFAPEIAEFLFRGFAFRAGLSLLAPHFARVRASEARPRWKILEKCCEKSGNKMEGIWIKANVTLARGYQIKRGGN